MKDSEIVLTLQKGDTKALEIAIELYSGYVTAVIERTLGKSAALQDKEELVSDTFVALWKKSDTLQANSNLKYWLAVVARHAAINKLRTIRPQEELEEDDSIFVDLQVPDAFAEEEEMNALVKEAVNSLSDEDKNLFLRHYFWHQSIPNIAKVTGMNPSTIKSRLFRGRQTLKSFLLERGFQYE